MSYNKYQSAIAACKQCSTACNQCASACLREKEVKMLARCIELDQDCSIACLVAADYMERGSSFSEKFSLLCAEVCDACAAECEKHVHMEHCKDCANACRKCAEACRNMSTSSFQ